MYFHVFCQIFNQLYDLYANLMNFFFVNFHRSVYFVQRQSGMKQGGFNQIIRGGVSSPRFLFQCLSLLSLQLFCALWRSRFFFVEEFFLSPKLYKLENIIFGFNNTPLRQLDKEVFFFFGNKKELYALAITKPIDKKIDFSDDSQ